jgi:hypothetical protein
MRPRELRGDDRLAPCEVDESGDRFEMRRAAARTHATEVIEVQALRDGTVDVLEENDVDGSLSSLELTRAVALRRASRPEPTRS